MSTPTAPHDAAIFHLCTRAALTDARAAGAYTPASLANEGFVHLSRAHQVLPTARAYFADVPDVVVLVVDPTVLSAPLVYEPPAPLPSASPKVGDVELYPHCYGPIDLAAIVDAVDLAQFDGQPVHADTVAMLRHFAFDRLPVEGTLFRGTWRAEQRLPSGEPTGTAMIGLYAESPRSHSLFHRLTHDEVWHVYGGDPFVLHLLHPDGRYDAVRMGSDIRQGEQVQHVVPAGTWQAGELVAGGRYALFGCTMAPGFTGGCFEAGPADVLRQAFPHATEVIGRLGVTHGSTRMPPGFAES